MYTYIFFMFLKCVAVSTDNAIIYINTLWFATCLCAVMFKQSFDDSQKQMKTNDQQLMI